MKKLLILSVAVILFGAGCSWFPTKTNPEPPPSNKTVTQTEPQKTEPLPPPTSTPSVFNDETGSIFVTNMTSGQLITNGFVVLGTANVFESQFSWRLEGADGRVITRGNARSRQPDMGVPGPFSFVIVIDSVPTSTSGTLVVFDNSAKDGSEISVVRIPVTFNTKTMAVKVFFGNSEMNPNAADCSLVYPVERVVPEGNRTYAAVNVLLKGPTDAEKKDGYYSSIPSGVVLQDVTTADGIPSLDFSATLQEKVGGSCRVGAIRSEIEHTALQGRMQAAVDAGVPVSISIDGRTKDILQP
jgi:hypothetical protein